MSYEATVLNVMIASPGDVEEERRIAQDVIHDWNAAHAKVRKVVLVPVVWETHTSPDMGDRPQSIVNRQILDDADLLVAIFWTKLGSGTVEEIERHVAAEKPAMLYFSSAPIAPDEIDETYGALCNFRDKCKSSGLVEFYGPTSDFRVKFVLDLAQTIHREFPEVSRDVVSGETPSESEWAWPQLSAQAGKLLLQAVAEGGDGSILRIRLNEGTFYRTNGKDFGEIGNSRSLAQSKEALEQLEKFDLVVPDTDERALFNVTDRGYKVADQLSKAD